MVAAGAGIYVYAASADDARQAATADASFAAHKAASQLSANLAFIDQTVQPLVTGSAGAQLIANPGACTLGYAPIGAFGAGHIDLVSSDGTVLCTSRSTGRGLPTYASQPWLGFTEPRITAPVRDPTTGKAVAVLTYPIGDKGYLAWFLELDAVGANLAGEFGSGVNDLEFLVITPDARSVLTRSIDPAKWSGVSLRGTTFSSAPDAVDRVDLSGTPRWYAQATVPATGWRVLVGASQATALASVVRLQQRQLAIIAVGLLAVMVGLLVAYRRVSRPIEALSSAVRARRSQDTRAHVPVSGPREVATLGKDINELIDSFNRQWADREQAERTYVRLFEGSPLPMVVSDASQRFLDLNDAAQKTFGYTREEFLALSGTDLYIPADDAERDEMAVHQKAMMVPDGVMRYGPITLRKKDGTRIRAVGTTYRVEYRGRPARVAVLEDVTLTESLQRHIKQTERLDALGQLAGGIAHDFNNLLSVILNVSVSLRSRTEPAGVASDPAAIETVRDLDRIDKAAQSAARLTRQLLSFARREVVEGEPLDLSEEIRGITELLSRTIGSHLVMAATLPDGLWPVVMDRGQLEQIVINLTVNARDAMGKGGRLTISTENFEVDDAYSQAHAGVSPGRYVRLQVADSGTGMDRATLDRLFEPFFTTKPAGHGTGLGLATVYGIVKQLHGDISVHSELGRGTTFTILLPATRDAVVEPPAAAVANPPAAAEAHGTVLVVEDYADLRELFAEILRSAGYSVVTAPDGEAGLAAARDRAGEIDVLLTDIVMPRMLGSDLARQLRAENPCLRVIYMSGHAQPALGGAVSVEPGTPFLQKPFLQTELVAKVREVLAAPVGDTPAVDREPVG